MRMLNRFGGGQSFNKVLAVGDSIFAGVGDTPLDYIQTPQTLVREALSGRRLSQMSAGMTGWLNANPGHDVLLHGGINDFIVDDSLVGVQNSLVGCVAQVEIQGRAFAFSGITPAGDYGSWPAGAWDRCIAFNAWAGDYLKSRDLRHVFIDPMPYLREPTDSTIRLRTAYKSAGADPIHLSTAGAQRFAMALDAMMGEARKMRRAA